MSLLSTEKRGNSREEKSFEKWDREHGREVKSVRLVYPSEEVNSKFEKKKKGGESIQRERTLLMNPSAAMSRFGKGQLRHFVEWDCWKKAMGQCGKGETG